MSTAAPLDDPIDGITSLDDLRRLAESVQTANRPRLVSIAGGGQITLAPTRPVRPKRHRPSPAEKAKADEAAFLSSAGGWKGLIDRDEFMANIREGRSSSRPLVVFPDSEEADESGQ